jgi:hypothetical protein
MVGTHSVLAVHGKMEILTTCYWLQAQSVKNLDIFPSTALLCSKKENDDYEWCGRGGIARLEDVCFRCHKGNQVKS